MLPWTLASTSSDTALSASNGKGLSSGVPKVLASLAVGFLLLLATRCGLDLSHPEPAVSTPFSGYRHTVVTHTERIRISGGSLVETVSVTTDHLRVKE